MDGDILKVWSSSDCVPILEPRIVDFDTTEHFDSYISRNIYKIHDPFQLPVILIKEYFIRFYLLSLLPLPQCTVRRNGGQAVRAIHCMHSIHNFGGMREGGGHNEAKQGDR